MRLKIKLLGGLFMGLICTLASAQADWPTKPIKIVVGFAAGTPPDIFARMYGDYASKKMGVPILIDNKPGAAGNLSSDFVAKSPADGYTFLYNLSTAFTINPFIYTKLPFDPQKDLVPVATTMRQGLVLITNPKFPANTIKELVASAKAKPGSISHASYGAGSPSHLIVEWMKDEAKIDMLHVPYRASPVSDLLGGQVDTLMEPIATAYPLISGGRAKALAYSGSARHPSLPDVPTLSEVVPGLSVMSWHGIWAPAATPANVLTRFNAVMVEASKDADMQKRIKDLNVEPMGSSRAEMDGLVRRDAEIFSKIIKAKNIRVD
ncbi:tripartite tricarboxylate transporter substrate binding protein [Polaromonas sp.]|jgi:tripartite-type tricarboxylate transporter receptor subunit TctC|uniref:Bug family tripartite tricarboxylate transporter substrate binding protein n=1 Tax=Polaromonas sp. TaxID=1869339 RepID=UPI001D3BE77A|nr:tripartite tricarboxylate transporter substrate binding protein [Polaromonas sp.]MBT9475249.1 tripartite tricarboxylate transporter substrate binding protein [Polaromonas sp.]